MEFFEHFWAPKNKTENEVNKLMKVKIECFRLKLWLNSAAKWFISDWALTCSDLVYNIWGNSRITNVCRFKNINSDLFSNWEIECQTENRKSDVSNFAERCKQNKSKIEFINETMDQHQRLEYCHTRLKYRDSKTPTAVKVYSIINESRHLFVFGVPKINLNKEIKTELQKYGALARFENVTNEMFRKGAGETSFFKLCRVFNVIFNYFRIGIIYWCFLCGICKAAWS